MKKTAESLGQRIARLRGKASQMAFAERAGLSRRTLQNMEDGTTESPGIDHIQQVARALEISTSELLGEEPVTPYDLLDRIIESPETGDPLQIAALLLERFAAAPPRLRAVVLAYLLQDFEVVRKYSKEIQALMPKPK